MNHLGLRPAIEMDFLKLASIRDNFRFNLKRLLKKHDLKQRHFAEKMEINPSMVSLWLSGTAFPEAKHMDKMAEVLNEPYVEFFQDIENDFASIPARDLDALIVEIAKARGFKLTRKEK